MAGWAPEHLNGNILGSIAINTTGPNPLEHEITDICILPLNSEFKPNKAIIPFYTCLKPERIDNVDKRFINPDKLSDSLLRGLEANKASDMVLEWFDTKLKIVKGKQIQVVTYDWPYIKSFLVAWMGFHQTELMFHPWYRDLIPYSLFANDNADLHSEQYPFPKSTRGFLESRIVVINEVKKETLSNCIAQAEMWRKLRYRIVYGNKGIDYED